MTNLSSISNFTLYYIAEDGVVSYKPEWSHTKVNCPIEYLVSRIEGSVERPLTSPEMLVLTLDKSNGFLDLKTSEYALDGEIWTIRLFMRSSFSIKPTMDGAYVF